MMTEDQDLTQEMLALDPHGERARAREYLLANKKIPSLVLSFVIPTMIGTMIQAIYMLVDRFWVGKMDEGVLAMAGVGLTLPLTTIAFSFMAMIGIGSTALISIKMGEKKPDEAQVILGNCVTLSFIVGTIIMLLGVFFARPMLTLFGASQSTLPYAMQYAIYIFAGNTFNTMQFSLSGVMRGVGHPTWSVMTQVAGAVTNMILDPIFIFKPHEITIGAFSLPIGFGMGVSGAALATVIAQIVSFILVSFYYLTGKSPVRITPKSLHPHAKMIANIAKIGSASFALQCAASLVQIVANKQLARYGGDLAISAMTLVNTIGLFCIMLIVGINQGLQPIIGYNYGAKNYRRVRSAYLFAVLFGSAITVVAGITIQIYPIHIIRIFSDSPELQDIAVNTLKTVMLVLPFLGFQIISANYFQFIGKSFIALIMTLLRQIILLIPLYFILPLFFGTKGIWYASPISDAAAILITTAVFSRHMFWLNQQIRNEKIHYINE